MMLHIVTTCRVLNKYFSFLSFFCVVYSLVFLGDANSTQNFLAQKSLNEWKYPTIFLVQELYQLQNPSSLQEEAIKMDSLHVHFKWVRRLHNNIKQHTRVLKMIYTLLHLLILITLNILYRKKHFTLKNIMSICGHMVFVKCLYSQLYIPISRFLIKYDFCLKFRLFFSLLEKSGS